MGMSSEAICRNCGNRFRVNMGGGFFFHLLHCDSCAEEKSMSFEELGEIQLRYLKGPSGPFTIATQEYDTYIQEHCDCEPLTGEEYHNEVERFAGQCSCGGNFTFSAPPRCPKCNSPDWRFDPASGKIMYD